MRCTHCGAMIPDDMLYCPECHMEVQIVPDYNPLEDVLAQEVKGSIEDATRQIRTCLLYTSPCVHLIEEGKEKECQMLYSDMVRKLEKKYLYS